MAGLEIELKAGLDPAAARLLGRRLGRLAGRPGTLGLGATYHDTADRRLQAEGIAFRVRREGRSWVQTVKWARTGEGGFQRVCEAECRLPSARPDLAAVADPALRSRLVGLIGEADMVPWFTTTVRRRLWRVPHPLGLVEVALDTGWIRAGDRAEAVLEAEFELKQGSAEAVFALAADVLGDLPADLLLPSKAARGVRLADGAAVPPVQRKPPAIDPATRAAIGWQAGLSVLATAIAAALHGLLTDANPEGPHQLRVALRRLRVLTRLYRPILDREIAREIAGNARRFGRLVSPLRDSDVLTDLLCAGGRADPGLAAALAEAGDRVRAQARSSLRAAGATGLSIRLLQLANLGGWQRRGDDRQVRSGKLMDRRMQRQWKAVQELGDRLSVLDTDERHAFRKNIKRLKYLSELYGNQESVREYQKSLSKLQESLGILNDIHVLEGWKPAGLPAAAQAAFEAARDAQLQASAAKADQALGRACRHWRALSERGVPSFGPEPRSHPEPNR
jgi:inorganic triphosphatase YgiF